MICTIKIWRRGRSMADNKDDDAEEAVKPDGTIEIEPNAYVELEQP
jgi:hypothetical protein